MTRVDCHPSPRIAAAPVAAYDDHDLVDAFRANSLFMYIYYYYYCD